MKPILESSREAKFSTQRCLLRARKLNILWEILFKVHWKMFVGNFVHFFDTFRGFYKLTSFIKGIVSVISRDPQWKNGNGLFRTVP